jgi:hypothetical protein
VITSTTAAPNRIETKNLHGGYFLLNYKADTDLGTVIPFTRWSYFNGARKFVANSPSQNVNEIDIGIEYQPWPSFEISLVFTRAFTRTNTSLATAYTGTQAVPAGANAATPAELATARTLANAKAQAAAANGGFYNLAKNVDRVTLQLQYNF